MDQPTRELDGDNARWSAPGLEIEVAAYSQDSETIGLVTRDGEIIRVRSSTGEVVRRWHPDDAPTSIGRGRASGRWCGGVGR